MSDRHVRLEPHQTPEHTQVTCAEPTREPSPEPTPDTATETTLEAALDPTPQSHPGAAPATAREAVRVHGLVAWHPAATGGAPELCIHSRQRPYEDTELPVATVCDALHCVRLEDPLGVLRAGTWCTVFGTIDAAAVVGTAGDPADQLGGGTHPTDPAHHLGEGPRLSITVDHLGDYPPVLRDSWSELADSGEGFGFIELSATLARSRSTASSSRPLRTTPELNDALEEQSAIVAASGFFDDDFGGGGHHVAGHGYANSADTLIVTDPMRAWLAHTPAEVVVCPVIQRRVPVIQRRVPVVQGRTRPTPTNPGQAGIGLTVPAR